jgi:hypothetical protein
VKSKVISIIALTSISTLLYSCSNIEKEKESIKATPTPSSTISANQSAKDFLKPRVTFKPTVFSEKEASALIMVEDLPDYEVYRPAYTTDTRERHPDVEYYNKCIGSDAPHVATITNTGHIDGDSFRHIYDDSILVTATSSVESSSSPLKDIEYLKTNKKHIKCLIDYFKIVRRKSLDYPVEITYKIISYKEGVLTARLEVPKIDTYPHQVVYIYTAVTGKHVIQYVNKLTSVDEKEFSSVGEEVTSRIYNILKRKMKLIE